jgi:enoyl-CoA hydratase
VNLGAEVRSLQCYELNHAHWAWVHQGGFLVATPGEDGVADWRGSPPVLPALRDVAAAAAGQAG